MKNFFFIFFGLLMIGPVFAQSPTKTAIGKPASLSSLATRQYLSGKSEESLALYQKAISKSESEYGKNSRIVGNLYYQLGIKAFLLSKFNLAENSLKKAVEINPNSEAARLMLIKLLKFRNRQVEAYNQIQQALKKHPESVSLHKDLVLSLQEREPAHANKQAYLISCIQNGISLPKPKESSSAEQTKQNDKLQKEQNPTSKDKKNNKQLSPTLNEHNNLTNRKAKTTANKIKQPEKQDKASANKIDQSAKQEEKSVQAVYEPVISPANKITSKTMTKTTKAKTNSHHKRINAMPDVLVPPPPPGISPPDFAAAGHPGMKARAGSIKVESAQPPQATEEPKKHVEQHSTTESDPDFLIEWASVKKKK